MAQKLKDDTSPATKADITALREAIDKRFESIDRRLESADLRFDSMDKRFESIDRRFDVFEQQLDSRFADIDRRFDTVDQQFLKVLEYIRAEGKECRMHTEKFTGEVMRHFDVRTKDLQDYFAGLFHQYTQLYGEKFRDHYSRIRALERGEKFATVDAGA